MAKWPLNVAFPSLQVLGLLSLVAGAQTTGCTVRWGDPEPSSTSGDSSTSSAGTGTSGSTGGGEAAPTSTGTSTSHPSAASGGQGGVGGGHEGGQGGTEIGVGGANEGGHGGAGGAGGANEGGHGGAGGANEGGHDGAEAGAGGTNAGGQGGTNTASGGGTATGAGDGGAAGAPIGADPCADPTAPGCGGLSVGCEGSPFASLRDAVEGAPEFATIEVCPGTYVESLRIAKSLTLRGAGPADVVLDADGEEHAVEVASGGPGTTVRLEGFTVRGATGRAIEAGAVDLTVATCVVRENESALAMNHGIRLHVVDTTIEDNFSDELHGSGAFTANVGIALTTLATAEVRVERTVVRNNVVESPNLGLTLAGAVADYGCPNWTLASSVIEGNVFAIEGGAGISGGALRLTSTRATVLDSRLADNTLRSRAGRNAGGAIALYRFPNDGSSLRVVRSSLVGNVLADGAEDCGGAVCFVPAYGNETPFTATFRHVNFGPAAEPTADAPYEIDSWLGGSPCRATDLGEDASLDCDETGCVVVEAPGSQPTDDGAVSHIGPDGGNLVVEEGPLAGFELVVPAGAVAEEIAFRVAIVDDPAAAPEGARSPVVRVYPEGLTFEQPVYLRLPVSDAAGATLWTRETESDAYRPVAGAHVDLWGNEIGAWVDHFSFFGVGTAPGGCICNTPEGGAVCSTPPVPGATWDDAWSCNGIDHFLFHATLDRSFTGSEGDACSGYLQVLKNPLPAEECKPWFTCYDVRSYSGQLEQCEAPDPEVASPCATSNDPGAPLASNPFVAMVERLADDPTMRAYLRALEAGQPFDGYLVYDFATSRGRELSESAWVAYAGREVGRERRLHLRAGPGIESSLTTDWGLVTLGQPLPTGGIGYDVRIWRVGATDGASRGKIVATYYHELGHVVQYELTDELTYGPGRFPALRQAGNLEYTNVLPLYHRASTLRQRLATVPGAETEIQRQIRNVSLDAVTTRYSLGEAYPPYQLPFPQAYLHEGLRTLRPIDFANYPTVFEYLATLGADPAPEDAPAELRETRFRNLIAWIEDRDGGGAHALMTSVPFSCSEATR